MIECNSGLVHFVKYINPSQQQRHAQKKIKTQIQNLSTHDHQSL